MSNKKKFITAMVLLCCLAAVVCAFACSRFAPRAVRHQRELVFADARTVLAAVRYLATPDLPEVQSRASQWETFSTEKPENDQPRRLLAATNMARVAISNQVAGTLTGPEEHG